MFRADPRNCPECSTSSGSHDISHPLGAFRLKIETLGDKRIFIHGSRAKGLQGLRGQGVLGVRVQRLWVRSVGPFPFNINVGYFPLMRGWLLAGGLLRQLSGGDLPGGCGLGGEIRSYTSALYNVYGRNYK